MHSLPIFLRLRDRPVILIGTGPAADAKRRLLERAGATVVEEGVQASLAIVAVEDDAEAESAALRLKARGVLINVTDRPALCDFTLPAIVDRNPVIVAIGTGGASAGLAKALRIAIEGLLPARLGELAMRLQARRDRIRQRWPEAGQRRHAIDEALSPGGPLDPLADTDEDAFDHWLTEGQDKEGTIVEIAVASADPDMLTLKDARLLGRADRIFHNADIPGPILNRARADATRISGAPTPELALQGLTLWLKWSG